MSDFISGIYNYCDRWCEKCAFTTRCRVFEMEQEDVPTDEECDIQNAAFWYRLGAIFAQTQQMLREKAEEFGIDLNAIPREEIEAELEGRREKIGKEYLVKLADSYARDAGEVLKLFETDGPEIDETTAELVQVVMWYRFMISVKISRGMDANLDKDEADIRETMLSERDGSIKVVMISIDRSISAWSGLLSDDNRKEILPIIALLQSIRDKTEEKFPQARNFIRPGFDEIGTVM